MNKDLVRIIENPVILQNLCTMRDKNTDSQGVRIATRKITRMLLYEASKNLPFSSVMRITLFPNAIFLHGIANS